MNQANTTMMTTGKCTNGHEMPKQPHFHSCPVCGEGTSVVAVPVIEPFPFAQVPEATESADVIAAWKERGFRGREMTREQALQRVVIEHDPLSGRLSWETSQNMDGLFTILNAVRAAVLMPSVIVADAALSIAEYFTRGPGQIDLGTGEASVIIAFKDGRLILDWFPKERPLAAKELLAAALLYFVAKDAGHPLERLLRAFGWRETDPGKKQE